MDQGLEELVERARGGDGDATRAIVLRLRPAIRELVRGIVASGVDPGLATEETTIAIAYAIHRYDGANGISFATYATHWMHACVAERLVRTE
jgi:DNA-directed RNA polymerase specialized sigma subunit